MREQNALRLGYMAFSPDNFFFKVPNPSIVDFWKVDFLTYFLRKNIFGKWKIIFTMKALLFIIQFVINLDKRRNMRDKRAIFHVLIFAGFRNLLVCTVFLCPLRTYLLLPSKTCCRTFLCVNPMGCRKVRPFVKWNRKGGSLFVTLCESLLCVVSKGKKKNDQKLESQVEHF